MDPTPRPLSFGNFRTRGNVSKTFVLLRYSSLGDIVLTSALVAKIAREHPDAEIVFLTKAPFVNFVASSFAAARLRVLAAEKSLKGIKTQMQSLAEGLSPETQLEILDLQGNLRSAYACYALKKAAKKRGLSVVGKSSPKHGFLRTLSVLIHKDLLAARHVFQEHASLVKGENPAGPSLRHVQTTPPTNSILLAPDAQHWKKRWPAAYWAELITLLAQNQYKICVVGDRSVFPENFHQKLPPGTQLEDLTGKTQLEDLASIAARHRLCICGNSAWLHISEAVGTPVLSLAGPIVKGFGFSPWRSQSRELALEDLFCRPCSKHGQGACWRLGRDYHKCMRAFSAQIVFGQLQEMLKS
jgi:heptosyltransferase-2